MRWRDELLFQLDLHWDQQFLPRLEGLTDDEYFWEPVPNCWTVRTGEDGSTTIDWQHPPPDPPPVTTIAWRLAHVAVLVFGLRASNHFGDGSLTITSARWPASADEALAALQHHQRAWRDGVAGLDDDQLQQPAGPAEGPYADHSMATLVLHLNREAIHHGAEVALLRDLYRARN